MWKSEGYAIQIVGRFAEITELEEFSVAGVRYQMEKARAVRDCSAEIGGDGLAHVGKRVANAKVDAALPCPAVRQDGDVFA